MAEIKQQKLFRDQTFVAGKTVFSVNHDRSVFRPHGIDRWILNMTVDGKGRVNSGPYTFYASTGDVLLFPPEVCHDYGIAPGAEDWIHYWVYFDLTSTTASLINWPAKSQDVLGFHINNSQNWQQILREFSELHDIFHDYTLLKSRRHLFSQNYLERLLLLIDLENPNSQGISDPRILKSLNYMKKNYSKPLKVADIAKNCGMSASRFAHLFNDITGTPPNRYLTKIRIEIAQNLLIGTDHKLSEIAEQTGFSDPYYFSNCFKQHTGQSPNNFRKTIQKR